MPANQHSPESNRWHVLGAGAMGCLWAAALQSHLREPAATALILRDETAVANYSGEITLEGMTGDVQRLQVPAFSSLALAQARSPVQNLVLSCKAQDAEAALASIEACLSDTSRIVLLQNGIRVQQAVTRRRPPGTVFCLSTSHGAWIRSPFHVVHAGQGMTWLGLLPPADNAAPPRALDQLLSELPASAMNISIDHDMALRLWLKLAVNCAINALTVFYNCQNGELLSNPRAKNHLQALCREISALTLALPECPVLPDLWQHVQQVATATRHNFSSTLQDIQRNRPTEIEHLNGWLCELAGQKQLPCPLNNALLNHVRQRQTSHF